MSLGYLVEHTAWMETVINVLILIIEYEMYGNDCYFIILYTSFNWIEDYYVLYMSHLGEVQPVFWWHFRMEPTWGWYIYGWVGPTYKSLEIK